MISNREKAVEYMMRTFNLNYSGWRNDDEGGKAKLWLRLLGEYDPTVINAATGQIVATRKSDYGWAPDIAFVREQCLNLSSGMLTNPTGSESWQRIMQKVAEPSGCENRLKLTAEENSALEQTLGKTAIYDLKHGNIRDLRFVRRDYVDAFDTIVAKQRLEILTPPSVKALVARNTPSLPVPAVKQIEAGEKAMSFAEAREEFGPDVMNLEGAVGE